ncbi:hypothetical protein CspeluHIS016_0504480 [Cutaneotrichosporon spelunceum]|uniref:Amino acid transporter transmembrane domain-containing protein n=1 Tax=Cutaneotrichosporon spelunceum TaxID=1672016 RepID=A0AAD3YCU5_9TREE|nr:hypothetical protein CspeluHIS016_0504480 [Cutaneotrichosporon spelunceum]
MPPSPPITPRSATFLGLGRPRPPATPEAEPLLDEPPGPSRSRSVSLAHSIASVASFVSAASSTGLNVVKNHSRSPSLTRPKSPRTPIQLQEQDELESDEDDRESLAFLELDEDLEWDDEWDDAGSDEPLVRRRRRGDETPGERALWELVAPLVLAHSLALFPALAAIPHDFLPAGVALFVPLLCIIALLSACAHVVIVYLGWYLQVRTFEDVFATCAGERLGPYALQVGRAFVMVASMGASVGWLGTLFGLFEPVANTYLPAGVLQARVFWVIIASATMIPALIPSRTFRSLRRAPFFLAILLPVVAFIAIGRTAEVRKLMDEAASVKRGLRVRGLDAGSAGSGLTSLTMFFSPHLQSLSVHTTLQRNSRQRFYIPCFVTSLSLVLISLPFALVLYYLLPAAPTGLAQLPADDGWTNFARVLMAVLVLGSTTTWLLRGRDCILNALDVDRGESIKAGRYVGLGMWAVVVAFAALGGIVAEKIELLGVIATLAVGWLLPSVFFIITFHVRSPLAIIFPRNVPPPTPIEPVAGPSNGHIRTASLDDPATDELLARKEHQLQKRRLGRRLWQDMVVYLGILPVGCVTIVWSVGSFLGL